MNLLYIRFILILLIRQLKLNFILPKSNKVEISVFNVASRFVSILLDDNKRASAFIINWDASNLASGMYFVKMKAGIL